MIRVWKYVHDDHVVNNDKLRASTVTSTTMMIIIIAMTALMLMRLTFSWQ